MTLPAFDLHRASSIDEASDLLGRYGDDAIADRGRHGAVAAAQVRLQRVRPPRRRARHPRADRDPHRGRRRRDRRRGDAPRDRALGARAGAAFPRSRRWSARSPTSACARRARSAATSASATRTPTRRRSCWRPAPRSCCAGAAIRPRVLPLGEFMLGPYETALAEGDLLVSIRVPATTGGHRHRAPQAGLPRAAGRDRRGVGARCRRKPRGGAHRRRLGRPAWPSERARRSRSCSAARPPRRSPPRQRRRPAPSRTPTAPRSTSASSSACWSAARCTSCRGAQPLQSHGYSPG